MKTNELTQKILDCAYRVHSRTGPGLLETAYETILAYELNKAGLAVQRQIPIPIVYDGFPMGEGFRADLMVNDCVIIELKSVELLAPVHAKQVLTQLRLSGKKVGLLINFGVMRLKDGIQRIVNGLEE